MHSDIKYCIDFATVNTLPVLFSCSVLSDSLQPYGLQHTRLPCSSPSPELAQIHVHFVSDAIQPSHPCLLLPSIFPNIRIFPKELALRIRRPKYWSFSFSINPANEYSGLISFRIDCFDLLAGQETLKSLLQHHNSKASILQYSAFFIVQLSSIHDYYKNHSFDYTCLCRQSNVSAL